MTSAARGSPDSVEASAPPRKKMRQGTHSCIECRRRKIKCTFRDDRRNVCNECFARGISCVDQESAADAQTIETKQSLRERVANLESLVRTLATKVDTDELERSGSEKSLSGDHAVADLSCHNTGLDHAPIMSLFNNSVIDGRAEPEFGTHATAQSLSGRTKSEDDKIRQKLLTYVPSERDIDIIWDECSYWWYVWGRMFPELSVKGSQSIRQFTKSCIKGGPILSLCKTLLCLALGLQQLSATFVTEKLDLPLPADQLIQHYISIVEKCVFGDDNFLSTLEGLELTIMLTKLNANAGRPRKAWLQYRRAISFALLLGYNRKASWQVHCSDTATGPRRRAVFWALYQGDRYFSIILGLPYSVSDQQCDIDDITKDSMDGLRGVAAEHMFRLSKLCGRLIDRCQNPETLSFSNTMRWDEELRDAAKSLPSLKNFEGAQHLMFDELYDRSLAVLSHHYARVLLHLPFMLKSSSDRRFEDNRTAAIESAREMIHSFKILRAGVHGGYCACKTVDFQVFLACILLVLNQLAFVPLSGQRDPTPADIEDWNLIAAVREILFKAAKESMGTSGAMQDSAVKTLNLLMDCKDCRDQDEKCSTESTKVSIPYFGTITISPRKEAILAMDRVKSQMITPAQTLSSAGSPAAQQWHQLPTPPQALDSLSSMSSNSNTASPAGNPYVAFDPVNIPLPAGFNNMNAVADTADLAFNDPLLTQDWSSGLNWWNLSSDGINLDLDNEWKWVTSNDPLLVQQGSLNPLGGQGMANSGSGPPS